tara:strand:- start:152 stop:760 length:609 start_codon:yes stop_codon:yes gene_type:complete
MSETIYQGEFMPSNPQFKTYSNKTAKSKKLNKFEKFMRFLAPPPGESASPYVNAGIYKDPLNDPNSIQSKVVNFFNFGGDADTITKDIERKLEENKKKEENSSNGESSTSEVPSFKDVMGMDVKDYLDKVAQVGERAKDRDMIREGVTTFANFPLIGAKAALESAANISQLTGVNMAAIANQGDVMAQNPTKQKIAGKYFRM